ncbi:MAG: hypothetical protein KAF91_24440 [Nostoc sp. TH1S01]|nr:hypothetical protein [Nostoc sp. TH1S01]
MEESNMTVTGKNNLTSLLPHLGKTPEEQLRLNQAAIKLLQKWMAEEVSECESMQREIYFESFKQIVDHERLSGNKIYSQE